MNTIHEAITRIAARTMKGAGTREISLALANDSVVFFPCAANKNPHVSGWQKLNSVSSKQALAWHEHWPDMMLGLPTGANGLLVIDLDKAKKVDEPDGLNEFQKICGKHDHDFMSATLCAKTGSGGMHVFYKMPAGHNLGNTVKRIGKAIDTRGNGGYVIIAPSIGERGKYEWLNNNHIAELPDWLLDLLTKDKTQTSEPLRKTALINGTYVNERERMAYQSALDSECSLVATAQPGIRNDTLNMASFKLGRYVGTGKLDQTSVYNALFDSAIKCGLPAVEASKTINSGLQKGTQNPKEISPYDGSWEMKSQSAVPGSTSVAHAREKTDQTLDEYLAETNAKKLIDGFLDEAVDYAKNSAIPTGYAQLDRLLDGGLYPGLYVIGAISSLGKTTFALQMADSIAKFGHDVLIFSLEMSKYELMAKTLSRISSQQDKRENARAARYYLAGKWMDESGHAKNKLNIYQLFDIYSQWASYIHIIEGGYNLDVLQMAEKIKEHIRLTKNIPVVFVDYLQIITPLSDRLTDKQAVDRNIVELKRLSRDLKLPVVAVSSFNRDSYSAKATMSAFKESGAIEYTSDVLLGLQFKNVRDKSFDVDEAKKANPREIELLLIKNRHGKCGEAFFKYYPKFNLFTE